MISFILKKIVGSQNEREVKKFLGVTEKINSLEEEMINMPSVDLRNKTREFIDKIENTIRIVDIIIFIIILFLRGNL